MRVVHVYHDFWPIRGGIEDCLLDLSRAQSTQQIESIVLCANNRPFTRHESLGRVRLIRAASFGRYFTPFCPSWPFWLRRLKPDIVHLHLPGPLGEWAVWLTRPRRLIISLHNDYVRPKAALKFHRPLHRAVLRQANAIIVGAPDYALTSPMLTDLQSRVAIVPYGIELQRYAPTPLPYSGGGARGGGVNRILCAGRLCYYKGVEVLLDAAPSIKAHVTIIGDGPWRKRLQAQARRNKLQERVCFRGTVSDQALLDQMRASDVFVFPSTERSEAFGIAQLKAMACGLPVVSSNLPGVSWLNRNGETGLTVPARDVEVLSSALNQLLADTPLRERLAAGAWQRAQQFPLSQMLCDTKRVYDSIA